MRRGEVAASMIFTDAGPGSLSLRRYQYPHDWGEALEAAGLLVCDERAGHASQTSQKALRTREKASEADGGRK